MRKLLLQASAAGAAFLMVATATFAATGYSFFGETSYVQPGYNSLQAVKMVSDNSPGYGGVSFDVPNGTTLASLNTLSTDFNVTEGTCGGGSPRFQITVLDNTNTERNIFAYLGQTPSFTCTPDVWSNSGDLLETGKTLDTSQLPLGTFYDPYDTALTKYGSLTVTGIQLVTDGGWLFGNQTVLADNVVINNMTYTFEPTREEAKQMCKNGGYETFNGQNGTPGPFKNQGECVSYFNHTL